MEVGDRLEEMIDPDADGADQLDPVMEPLGRGRANTWHGRLKFTVKDVDMAASVDIGSNDNNGPDGEGFSPVGSAGGKSKGTTRRNAWGNLSYADLITNAIESSPEKRMTLSQIYSWMVQNVPFFKDKGDSNSSAGWKNSIRHNLSLHNRFQRTQNEGTGKSSWWMINPDAKSIKAPRRRAATMDTKVYAGKRGRTQRSVGSASSSDMLNVAGESGGEKSMDGVATLSPPQDYRGRTSSNASSIGGFSQMEALDEAEGMTEGVFDCDVVLSPSPSTTPWNAAGYTRHAEGSFDETLSESLADIFVGNMRTMDGEWQGGQGEGQVQGLQQQLSAATTYSSSSSTLGESPFVGGGYALPDDSQPPLALFDRQYRVRMPSFPVVTTPDARLLSNRPGEMAGTGNLPLLTGSAVYGTEAFKQSHSPRLSELLVTNFDGLSNAASNNFYGQGIGSVEGNGGNVFGSATLPNIQTGLASQRPAPVVGATAATGPRQINSQLLLQLLANKPQLMAKIQHLIQVRQRYATTTTMNPQQQQRQLADDPHGDPSVVANRPSMLQQLLVSSSTNDRAAAVDVKMEPDGDDATATTTPAPSCLIPSDLDLNFGDVDTTDIDCDIEQVIKHELTFGDKLDFSFDQLQTNDS